MNRAASSRPRALGVRIPTSGDASELELVIARAREAERSGLSSVWVSDHLVIPDGSVSPYPFEALGMSAPRPGVTWLDAITVLSAMAIATSKLRLGTAALVAGLRPVAIASRQLRTVQVMAPDRLVVGLAAGWLREEFEFLGRDPTVRWRDLDEWTSAAASAWAGADRSSRPPPLLVAGNSAASRKRTVDWGDGWLPQQHLASLDLAWLADSVNELDRAWTERGRLGRPAVIVRLSGRTESSDLSELVRRTFLAGADEIVVDALWLGASIDPTLVRLANDFAP